MVIPWAGFSLSKLLALVEPTADAKYVAFETLHDPARMPGQKTDVLEWPYVEGLRLDEAMHPLALLATGPLRPGAAAAGRRAGPPRDAVEVRLQGHQVDRQDHADATQPPTTWNLHARPESTASTRNVNPHHDHPRWSQATEQRIGESGPAQDADVQRLRRSGREPLRGHGSRCRLLIGSSTRRSRSGSSSSTARAGGAARVGRVSPSARRQRGQLRDPHDRPRRPGADHARARRSRRCAS